MFRRRDPVRDSVTIWFCDRAIEAEADEIERPTLRRFVWAMKGLKANKDTGNFGDDIKVVHAWLRANP